MIGIDLVEVDRIRLAIERTPRFLQRLFTAREIADCQVRANRFQSLAARFAAKEAFRKIHPSLCTGIKYQEVEVLNGAFGRPEFRLHGEAQVRVANLNIYRIDLSLSHTNHYAAAAVVAVYGNEGDFA